MRAHRKLGKMELKECKDNRIRVLQIYQGKTALLATFEQMDIEDDYTKALRAEVHKLRTRLQNMGAL